MKQIREYMNTGARGEKYLNCEFLADAKDFREFGEVCAKVGEIGECIVATFRGPLANEKDFGDLGLYVARSADEIRENLDKIEKVAVFDNWEAMNGYVTIKVDGERVQIGFSYGNDGFVFDVSGTNIPVIKKVAEELKKI